MIMIIDLASISLIPMIMIMIIIIIIIILYNHLSFSEPTILGFNEPNHADQSNLDPETAAYSWLELQQAYPDKVLKMIREGWT